MKKGNWKSRRSYKRDLNGCHRVSAPAGRGAAFVPQIAEISLGAQAMAVVAKMLRGRGDR